MRPSLATTLIALLCSSAATYAQDETHPFSIHDMLAMKRLGGLQVSPDGSRLLFQVRTTDLESNGGSTDLWLCNVDGSDTRTLTTHPSSDWNGRWSKDGRSVLFLSTRSGSAQLWRIHANGGEAQQVSDLPLPLGGFELSPDGGAVAFALEVFPGTTIAETRDRLDEEAERKSSGMLYEQLFIRHWDTWKDGRRNHVFVAKLTENGHDEPVDVMKDMDADCPTKPFGGNEDFTFTPDGLGIVFCARDAGREEAWSTDFDLWRAPVDGSAPPLCLTENNEAWDAAPVFSPDGRTLAYLAMERAGYESDRFRITLRSWPSGETRTLTDEWDRSPGSIAWSTDGAEILCTAGHLGQHPLFAVSVEDGSVRTLVEFGSVRGFAPAGDHVYFGRDHHRSPVEFHRVASNGGASQQITHVNAEALARTRMGNSEQFTFAGWNDETVYCYVMEPVDFDPAKKYPVAFLIHGGPQGSYGNDFHYRWNPQAYAGRGYAAVMVDFHGSTGYGQAFTDSIRGDWGGKPLVDLQKGLAAALERYPWMDGERVAALGASFGGYMINWIAGQWPDRFRCFVNHDGNLDERMAYYDTEELWFPEWENHGPPWESEHYAQHNPIDYVHLWQTPMLVIHGALDFRVVDTQGISTFTALQRRGIPSQFLYFPDENHWVLSPHNSILWHETVLSWLDRWTRE